MPRPITRPIDKPVVPVPSPVDFLASNYLRAAPQIAKSAAATNIFNPVPSITEAVNEGRLPSRGEVGTDAAFAAAGMIPFGGKAARPALETGQAIAARRQAIDRLLNKQGPDALSVYLDYPITAYRSTLGQPTLAKFFRETSERIPAGTQMYRAPSAGQVQPRYGSQSVPLPREVGAEWLPNRIQSTAGSEDLQRLGALIRGTGPDTGGNQTFAPGMVSIEAMEDLPGVLNLNDFLARYNAPNQSNFSTESVLGPGTRYVVRDFVPSGSDGLPTWYLNAYNR